MTTSTLAVLGLVAIVAVAAVGWFVVDDAEVSIHLLEQNKQEDRYYDGPWLDYRDQPVDHWTAFQNGKIYGVRYTTAEEIARELAAVTIGSGERPFDMPEEFRFQERLRSSNCVRLKLGSVAAIARRSLWPIH